MARGVRSATGWRALGVLLAASAIMLAGCTGTPIDVDPLVTETPAARPVGTSGKPVTIAFSPLRGAPADWAAMQHPSIAVKIDDHEEARPQITLNRTDIVFEELVEGGLTRYVAIWHSDVPDEVGPVRSIRPMDPDIVTPFGGIIAYSGGQDQFVAMMQAAPVVNIVFDYDDTGLFHRADERPGPHDVILAASEAVGRYPDLPPPPVQFAYGDADPLADPALEAAPTSGISQVFSEERYPSWSWDAATSTWLRSQEGQPDMESSGDRVRAVNVVTMRVGIDWTYGDVPKTVMVGSGEVWASVAGRTAHGTWSKKDAASPIVLTSDAGEPLRLAPGNTWIELVPTEGSVTFAP
ncbi:DUF3048 domain-containing protein [Agromyces sp. Marseille-Q5079]|uniref:DUF3048 domain-containing protein n=1 Tax=Agromyces sp. Marseille-Q5079 TaxID=3439059 RepID=UPI003D9C8A4B